MTQEYNNYTAKDGVQLVIDTDDKRVTVEFIDTGLYRYRVRLWVRGEKLHVDDVWFSRANHWVITDAKLNKLMQEYQRDD